MSDSFVMSLGENYSPDPGENIYDSIFREYERVIFESIVSSFGLEFIMNDRHGGDVDTIHNVRQIGKDSRMEYKNRVNEAAYANRGDYNYGDYHDRNKQFQKTKSDARKNAVNGVITDEYTGGKVAFSKSAPPKSKASLDHVIAGKEIHDDRGRILAGLDGSDLANSPENLKYTNMSLNSSMQHTDIPEYIEKHPELPEETKRSMMVHYRNTKKWYEKQVSAVYYKSPQFIKDTAGAAGKLGAKMGLKQVFGFFFANVWCAIRDEFEKAELDWGLNLDLGVFFKAIGNGVKRGFDETMSVEGLKKFLQGEYAGVLSSLTTTICNIFFTTGKNIVKIIRQSYSSIIQAAKVLFINPDGYYFGDRMLAVTKILATGASVVVGNGISIAIEGTPVGQIPVVGDIVQGFLGSLVTGILSCTLLLYLDRSETTKSLVNFLNNVDNGIDMELESLRQQAKYFENYAAELMEIDIDEFQKEIDVYTEFTDELLRCDTYEKSNQVLKDVYERLKIAIPWKGDFDEFMSDKTNRLVFE